MEIKIFCCNCKVEILRADTDTLRTPLIGSMFKVKKDMEWNLFSPHDFGKDLICPMCEWTFHEEGRVSVPVNGDFVIGKPEVIIPGIVACATNNVKLYGGISSGGMAEAIQKEKKEEVKNAEASAILVKTEEIKKKVDKVAEEMKAGATEALYPAEQPALKSLEEQVEGPKKAEEVKKVEQPQLNHGDWNKSQDANENSEIDGKAPPGTEAIEPVIQKKPAIKAGWLSFKKAKKRNARRNK